MASARRIARNAGRSCLCVLAALTASCAAIEPSGAEDIKVVDSAVVSLPLAWIDNERILMRVDTGERITPDGGGRIAIFHLISYNYKTGDRHDYGRVGSQICYADGYVSHGWRADDDRNEVIVAYGELGKETKRRVKPGELNFERGARGSCRPWSEHPPKPKWAKENIELWSLWPRLGFVSCQTRYESVLTKHIRARFHRPNDEVGVELPFSCYAVFGGLRYYPYKGAYFALEHDYRHPWPENTDRRAFWLYPNGHVETLTFPYSQAIRDEAIPVRDGILAFSRPATRKDDYWVYYVTPNSTKRLYRGSATGITSPDGCKVAMLLDPDFKAKVWSNDVTTPVSLKILDFCSVR